MTLATPQLVSARAGKNEGDHGLSVRRSAAPSSDRLTRRVGMLTIVLVVGYLVTGRSFAYIGLSSVNVYIGEVVLGLLIALPRTRTIFATPVRSLTRGGPTSLLATCMAALVALGVLEFYRGLNTGFSLLYALRNLPFDYYPFFLFLGVWAAHTQPTLLRRTTWWLAVVNAIYGPIYVVFLSHLPYSLPGNAVVPLFGTGTGSGLALLGILAHHRSHRLTPVLAALNVFSLLGNQIRSEWTAVALGLIVWCVATKRVRILIQSSVAVLLALIALGVAHVSIPGAAGRGGTISLGGVFGRLVAAVDPALASRYTTNTKTYADNVSWRTDWWHAIWASSNSSEPLRVLGHGYGFTLSSLTSYVPVDTRTPHNVFFYALGYTGWLGVVLLAAFWTVLLGLLLRQARLSGDWYGITAFIMAIVIGSFGDWFETPFGAIPSYLLAGLALGPALGSAWSPNTNPAVAVGIRPLHSR